MPSYQAQHVSITSAQGSFLLHLPRRLRLPGSESAPRASRLSCMSRNSGGCPATAAAEAPAPACPGMHIHTGHGRLTWPEPQGGKNSQTPRVTAGPTEMGGSCNVCIPGDMSTAILMGTNPRRMERAPQWHRQGRVWVQAEQTVHLPDTGTWPGP